jgi:uncharacterized repeat protein (TIGR01451 family)
LVPVPGLRVRGRASEEALALTTTRTFSSVTDDGLLFSNITASETGVGTFNSVLADPALAPVALTNLVGVRTGLDWRNFVGGATGPGSSLSVEIEYDITSLTAGRQISGIAQNSFVPDTVIPIGATLTLRQEIYAGSTLVGVSQLTRTQTTNDSADPPFELATGDFNLPPGTFSSLHVKLTIGISIATTVNSTPVPANTSTSFSIMTQAYNTAAVAPAAIGDFVFEDANRNGIRDTGEGGIAGVQVQLLDANGTVVGDTVTGSDGSYSFTNQAPGIYTVRFEQPSGYLATTANAGADDLDSDADPLTGLTGPYTLLSGQTNNTVDAGFYRGPNSFIPAPSLSVEKLTNGVDGPVVLEGSAVTWTYAVRNTGNVTLSNVQVTDDIEGAITSYTGDDGNGALDVGEVWTFVKSGVAGSGDYANVATASGSYTYTNGTVATPTATDPSNYVVVRPSLSIDKLTNGVDGPVVLAGSSVTWTYAVRNTGDVAISNVQVADDREGAITSYTGDNGNGVLDVGEVWTFVKSGVAGSSDYVNTGTVTGSYTDSTGRTVNPTAEDDSSYDVVTPSLSIDKLTNGVDGPVVLAGSSVTWTYAVRNTGDVAISNVQVADDREGAITSYTGDDGNGVLDVGEVWTFTKSGVSGSSDYENVATVTGSYTDSTGRTVNPTAEDDSSYDVVTPSLSIDKLTNGVDGPVVLAGSSVTWTYAVRNTGDVAISNVQVADDREGAITSYTGDDGNGVLDVGEVWTFTKSGVAGSSDYENIATVTGSYTDSTGRTVNLTAEDDSSYDVVTPSLSIDKLTNGVDGPVVLAGSSVTWTYAVRNTGDVALSNVQVADDREGAITSYTGDDGNGVLDVGEVWTFTKSGVAGSSDYENVATVTGSYTDSTGRTVNPTAEDDSSYDVVTPSLSIDKLTNGVDGPVVLAGSSVTWTYAVRNTGDVALSNVQVADDREGAITSYTGDDGNGVLDVVEVWTFTKSGVAGSSDYVNTGTVTGSYTDSTGRTVNPTAEDDSSYDVVTPSLSISKLTNGVDGAVVLAGSAVTWTYTVRNTGDVALSGVQVTDDREGVITAFTGDANSNGALDLGEIWTFTKSGIAQAGGYANTGTVTGSYTDSTGRTGTPSASDPSSYTGVVARIDVEKLVSVDGGATFQDADTATGPSLAEGGTPIFRFVVTNTGTTALTGVTVDDDMLDLNGSAAGGTRSIGNLSVGQVFSFDVAGSWVAGQHTNVATARGSYTDAYGNSADPTDSDAANYVGVVTSRPSLDLEKTTTGIANLNPIAPTWDNEDTASGAGVPIFAPGAAITWNYRVANTGNTTFTRSEIVLVDDNGTTSTADDMSIANGKVVFDRVETGDSDDLLEAGEVWLYKASGVAKDLSALGAAATFDFSGSSALDGTDGNVRSYSAGGISVKATAFSRDGTGIWQNGFLGAFGGGLGVTDRGEGDGSGNTHTIDNVGRDNYVLFRFDQQVVLDKAFLGYVVCDSDLTVWIGNISNAFNTTVALNDTVLNNLGFTEVNDTTSTSARWAELNAGNVAGNVIVIAASTADSTPDDYFKLDQLVVRATTGTNGVYSNKATVSAQGVSDSDLSHYINGTPRPGLDLEKTTTGAANQNTVAPTWDNEDTASGAGVPIFAPGAAITWNYRVANTGNTTFTRSEIVLVDDNGTTGSTADDMSIANGRIVFDRVETGDSDDLLEAGEVWLYKASGTALNLTTTGPATTFDFSGSSAVDGTDGNVRSYSANNISVKATAFSRDGAGTWQNGFLGAFGGGLGVTDRGESGSGVTHTVDNVGRNNYVLFTFNQQVVLDKAFLGYVNCDSDMQVWIGNISNAFNTTVTLNDAVLNGLGFTEVNDTTSTSARWAELNAGNVAGNVIVIAASTTDTTPDDYFKIDQLVVSARSSGGAYSNLATVSAQGVSDSDLSHYTNVVARPAIDLEKTTNGPSNSNPIAPDWHNEDTATGDGVPILTAGSTVTWTYRVTNTGNTSFNRSDIRLVDDNGTPTATGDDLSIANGRIVFDGVAFGDGDDLFEAGEVWMYKATDTVKNLATWGSATTFDFSGSSAVDGTDGNVRSYSAGGVSVKATAFSRDGAGTWQNGFLGSFSGGLGVTDRGESGSGVTHTVDNVGRNNYVVFTFSEQVVVDRAYLGYVNCDSDLRVWIGNISNAFNTTVALNDTVLNNLGFTEANDTTSTSARWADFNAGNVAGNVLVIAASTTDTTPDDYFKIDQLLLRKAPTIGVYQNLATVTAGGVSDSDYSHYTNPGNNSTDIWC